MTMKLMEDDNTDNFSLNSLEILNIEDNRVFNYYIIQYLKNVDSDKLNSAITNELEEKNNINII